MLCGSLQLVSTSLTRRGKKWDDFIAHKAGSECGGNGWGGLEGEGVAEGGSREAAFCEFDFKSVEG